MIVVKTLLFLLLVPGLLLGVFPFRLSASDVLLFSPGFLRWLALPFWLGGWAGMPWCMAAFVLQGHGTPAPLDPPGKLVMRGSYRLVRNPMYLSGLIILLGWVLWSPSFPILLCPLLFFSATHLFIVLYEEPHLKKVFGMEYETYCRSVPRWLPRRPESSA